MSRGIGQLQRKILAFSYATNKAFHGGEYRPPPGIFKPYPERWRGKNRLYIATDATGDLHSHAAMAHIFGLKRQDPKRSWEWRTKNMEYSVTVRPSTDRSWIPKDDPKWATARSATSRAIANLKERRLLAWRYESKWQTQDCPWEEDDRKANFGLRDRNRFKWKTPEHEFNCHADEFLTLDGLDVAKKEPPIEFDFKDLFGFMPELLG